MLERVIVYVDGTGVIEGEYAVRVHPVKQRADGFERRSAIGDTVGQPFVERQSGLLKRLVVPLEPPELGDGRLVAPDVGDSPASGIDQAFCGVVANTDLIRLDPGVDGRMFLRIDDNNLQIVEHRRHADIPVGELGVDIAVHAPAEHPVDIPVDIAFTVGVDDEHHVPQLPCRVLGPVDDLARVRGGGDLVADERDGVGPAAA